MAYIGIDYGMGQTNRDAKTGIRYGVISQNSVLQAWADSAEPDYGEATCPKCGNAVREMTIDDVGDHVRDYFCENCTYGFDSEQVYGEEPIAWNYEGDGYKLTDCLDNDIFVLESPYYTFAQFCSPCVPGAGNLDSPMPDGVQCYCLGHDWFEDGKAPYPVYSVETNEEIKNV